MLQIMFNLFVALLTLLKVIFPKKILSNFALP